MNISSWWKYEPHALRELIDSALREVTNWQVAVIYGPTSAEDRLYISNKPQSEWSVYDVLNGLADLGVEAEWLDPTKPDFVERIRDFDAAFINVHGEFGEDGNLQGLLAYLGIPYTGSGVSTSAIGADKRLTKLVLSQSGIMLPPYLRLSFPKSEDFNNLGFPLILKAVNGGSSVGMELVNDSSNLINALERIRAEGFLDVIAESFIQGTSVTVPAIRINNDAILLPPVECITDNQYYDQESKLRGDQEGIVRYNIFTDVLDERLHRLHDAVRKVLDVLDFEGAFRVDFILGHNNQPILLELNTIPGVQHGSNLVLSANAIGINYPSLLGIILASAKNLEKIGPWVRRTLVK
jgi:D-alanine-D-alanine ligase